MLAREINALLTYSPERIKYPMARVAGTKRGEGKFERISWDEANRRIASEWLRVLKEYVPEAVHRKYGTGTLSSICPPGNPGAGSANTAAASGAGLLIIATRKTCSPIMCRYHAIIASSRSASRSARPAQCTRMPMASFALTMTVALAAAIANGIARIPLRNTVPLWER